MNNVTTPTMFDAFNARALQPHQVAETFVPSDHYTQLAKQSHTLIVGPRGSGKTTLLKMLQQPALEAWNHPDAKAYRDNIDFTGVFVPTDVSWRDQVNSLGNLKLEFKHAIIFNQSAFTTHVLRALVTSMMYRTDLCVKPGTTSHRRVKLSPENEKNFAKLISTTWRLDPQLPTLLGLKYALNSRLADIHAISSQESLRPDAERDHRLGQIQWLHIDFLQSAAAAVELFDDLTASGNGRWALLFDELELAPSWLLERLLSSLRSVEERFLFKLSLSPFSKELTSLEATVAASEGQDYDTIPLWYAHKEESYEFCRSLIRSMLKEKGFEHVDVDQVFGRSYFETNSEEWIGQGTAYRPGTRLQARFSKMAEADRSFADYLKKKEIKPDLSNIPSGDARAADIRKIASVLTVREAFRASDAKVGHRNVTRLRSRKNPTLYTGTTSLFAISEGNPRWLKGIVGQLLGHLPSVPASNQATEIQGASHRFRALLKTIPCPSILGRQPTRGLLSVLDNIGDYFFKRVVVEPFQPEPPGSFIIDSRTDPELFESLGRALNAGAIVYVPDDASTPILSTLRGKRFRLSHLLAPYYQLPLVLGKPISLSSILEKNDTKGLFDRLDASDE